MPRVAIHHPKRLLHRVLSHVSSCPEDLVHHALGHVSSSPEVCTSCSGSRFIIITSGLYIMPVTGLRFIIPIRLYIMFLVRFHHPQRFVHNFLGHVSSPPDVCTSCSGSNFIIPRGYIVHHILGHVSFPPEIWVSRSRKPQRCTQIYPADLFYVNCLLPL